MDMVFKPTEWTLTATPAGMSAIGVDAMNHRSAERSVAAYKLDSDFLQMGLIPHTEFAGHGDQYGTVMAFVEPAEMRDPRFDWDSAVVRRDLNRMQFLDALMGQVDRHYENVRAETDGERILGLRGIDNDMSFGKAMTDLSLAGGDPASNGTGVHLRKLPDVADQKTYDAFMALEGPRLDELKEAMSEYLSPAEVNALIQRLEVIQSHLDSLHPDRILRQTEAGGDWTREWDSGEATELLAGRTAENSLAEYLKTMVARAEEEGEAIATTGE
jgi:hypothetical protein